MGNDGMVKIWLGSTPIQVNKEDAKLVFGDGHGADDLWLVPSPHGHGKFYLYNRRHVATCVTMEGLAGAYRNACKPEPVEVEPRRRRAAKRAA